MKNCLFHLVFFLQITLTSSTDFNIRLRKDKVKHLVGESENSGIIEIEFNSTWYGACYSRATTITDRFTKYLICTKIMSKKENIYSIIYSDLETPNRADNSFNIYCHGHESDVSQCKFEISQCKDSSTAGAICWEDSRGDSYSLKNPRLKEKSTEITINTRLSVKHCKNEQDFKCSSGVCIYKAWVCDGNKDCFFGEDEENCTNYLDDFDKFDHLKPAMQPQQTWRLVTPQGCAIKCAEARDMKCASFAFRERSSFFSSLCLLSNQNRASGLALQLHQHFDYYEKRAQLNAVICNFTCGDGVCVADRAICDGSDDCPDGSDEKDCADPDPDPDPEPPTFDFEVRIVNGSSPYEGRVEVSGNGSWGIVCDDGWELQDAHVLCREAGFPQGAVRAFINSHFGYGNGIYFMDDVSCHGNETSISGCKFGGWGIHNCGETEAAAVECARSTHTDPEPPPSDFAVRIVNGSSPNEGRVEVRGNGVWGIVCDDEWELPDAHVLCREAGFGQGAMRALNLSHFGYGNGIYFMDDVGCHGNETSISRCQFGGWRIHNCRQDEAAAVVCAGSIDTDPEPPPSDFAVRIVNGSTPNEGRVEVRVNGDWGVVCDNGWDFRDAHVLCREAGFTQGAMQALTNAHFGNGNGIYFMDNADCHGNETSISRCKFGGWKIHNCRQDEAAAVVCAASTLTECELQGSMQLRLADGPTNHSGRVEVRYRGVWGTICDDHWDDADALVVCRSLGYFGAAKAHGGSRFGAGTGPIWLDDVHCSGLEPDLLRCDKSAWSKHKCNHKEDAGVTCSEGERVISVPPLVKEILPRDCGTRSVIDNPKEFAWHGARIFGGMNSQYGAHPWQVGVRVQIGRSSLHWCGGTIISELFVISAANCFVDFSSLSHYVIRSGDYDNEVEEKWEKEYLVDRVFIHEEFNSGRKLNNDIVLVKIKPDAQGRGFRFNSHIRPACLPTPDTEYTPGIKCYISGWGSTGNSDVSFLQSAEVPLLSRATCSRPQSYGFAQLTAGMFCAGDMAGGVDSCKGDRGGPFVCETSGRFVLYGIVSWGHGCAVPNKPGVYVTVRHYLGWIYDKLVEDRSNTSLSTQSAHPRLINVKDSA